MDIGGGIPCTRLGHIAQSSGFFDLSQQILELLVRRHPCDFIGREFRYRALSTFRQIVKVHHVLHHDLKWRLAELGGPLRKFATLKRFCARNASFTPCTFSFSAARHD